MKLAMDDVYGEPWQSAWYVMRLPPYGQPIYTHLKHYDATSIEAARILVQMGNDATGTVVQDSGDASSETITLTAYSNIGGGGSGGASSSE